MPWDNPKRALRSGPTRARARKATLRRETLPARAPLWHRQLEERTRRLPYEHVVSQQGLRAGELVPSLDAMGLLSKRQRVEAQIILE